jgi:hypothetical protein
VRIWKFKPKRFQIDKGWHNSSLTKDGLYISQDLDQQMSSPPPPTPSPVRPPAARTWPTAARLGPSASRAGPGAFPGWSRGGPPAAGCRPRV